MFSMILSLCNTDFKNFCISQAQLWCVNYDKKLDIRFLGYQNGGLKIDWGHIHYHFQHMHLEPIFYPTSGLEIIVRLRLKLAQVLE